LISITDVNGDFMAISEAEAVIMEVLWRQAPRSAEEILAEVGMQQDWQEGTVKSLLNRLLTKKAVKAERDGRRYLYSPRLTREQYVSQESKGLLDRLFEGRVAPLVAHFSEQRKLSKRDIAELRKLLEELDDEQP
jgi:predicted transcriptional regulator